MSTTTTTAASKASGAAAAPGTTVAAAAAGDIPSGPIKLGFTATLSGPYAAYGLAAQAAWGVVVKWFNATYPDGIAGHPIEVDFRDAGSTTATGVAAAQQLVADHVAAIVLSSATSTIATAQEAVWSQAKIPQIVDQPALDEYTDGTKWPYVFETIPADNALATTAAKWLATQTAIKRIGILESGATQQTEYVADFKKALASVDPG
ncbi:MAG TPA: ABC transporter substrate-binding protein, partial [Ilumatobacteraceae bacterium]